MASNVSKRNSLLKPPTIVIRDDSEFLTALRGDWSNIDSPFNNPEERALKIFQKVQQKVEENDLEQAVTFYREALQLGAWKVQNGVNSNIEFRTLIPGVPPGAGNLNAVERRSEVDDFLRETQTFLVKSGATL